MYYVYITKKELGSLATVYFENEETFDFQKEAKLEEKEGIRVVPLEQSPEFFKAREDLIYLFVYETKAQKNYFLNFLKKNFEPSFTRYQLVNNRRGL